MRRFTQVEVGIIVKFAKETVKMLKAFVIITIKAIETVSVKEYSYSARKLISKKAVTESTESFRVIKATKVIEVVPAKKIFKELD